MNYIKTYVEKIQVVPLSVQRSWKENLTSPHTVGSNGVVHVGSEEDHDLLLWQRGSRSSQWPLRRDILLNGK